MYYVVLARSGLLHPLASISFIMTQKNRAKIYKYKKYAHFDDRVHWRYVYKLVENPDFIKHHGFYPFIHYIMESNKYPKKYISSGGKRDEPKKRKIMYSAHIDRYIYEYYAWLLNGIYNSKLKKDGTNNCVIAYRQLPKRRSNIHFARDVFKFIKSQAGCTVIIGDFTEYFDHIDHQYLKSRLCDLLDMSTLPDDYYAVFKSITKYSYITREKLIALKEIGKKEFYKLRRVLTTAELHNSRNLIERNENSYGIPQGSAISAFFSNAYMLVADKKINDYITARGGLYRRYCDDFVVVIPSTEEDYVRASWEFINQTYSDVGKSGIDLNPRKTKVYRFDQGQINSCNSILFDEVDDGPNLISYLGFTFDGRKVRVRQKTIAKFYSRMYRKIDKIRETDGISKNDKPIPMSNLYRLYSYNGVSPHGKWKKLYKGKRGNFLSYVKRASLIFEDDSGIKQDTRHAWGKLQKRLHTPMKIPSENLGCQHKENK